MNDAAREDGAAAHERERQIRALLPLVRTIARRVQRMLPTAEIDDLVGDGCVGLIRAVDAFDPARGVPLGQYARKVVLGAMLNGVRRLDPVAERRRRVLRSAERERYALAHELGTLPTRAAMEQRFPELADARVDAYRRTPLSLDASLPEGERFAYDAADDPQTIVTKRVERAIVRRAVVGLPRRQRRIVVAHYFAERSLRSLCAPLAISPQRVSQLHANAMHRLRRALAEPAAS